MTRKPSTKQADSAKESIKVLKEKIQKVLENQSERNHWISHFTQFSTMETLDRKALVHMVKTIKVISKTELDIDFTYKDEYERALKVIKMTGFTMQPEEQEEMTEQRKAG